MNRRARGGGNSNCRWQGILIVADQELKDPSFRITSDYVNDSEKMNEVAWKKTVHFHYKGYRYISKYSKQWGEWTASTGAIIYNSNIFYQDTSDIVLHVFEKKGIRYWSYSNLTNVDFAL